MSCKEILIEQQILRAVRKLLTERVNEVFRDWELLVPVIEFGSFNGKYAVPPALFLSTCERTEKERLIRLDAYSLTISFTLMDDEDGELFCYAYSSAVTKILKEDVTLGGIADNAEIVGKKYTHPKRQNCGEGWGLSLTLRITVGD